MHDSPPFGQADLSNCERELIHLAGSIQPHGVLLVLAEADGRVLQVSANCEALIGLPAERLLQQSLAVLGGDLEAQVRQLARHPGLGDPQPFQAHTQANTQENTQENTQDNIQAGAQVRRHFGLLHRVAAQQVLVLELEPAPASGGLSSPAPDDDALSGHLAAAVQRFTQAASIGVLGDSIVQSVREITGYDRVMVYKFDPDGHGKIIAEARHARLDTLLGHHYPATDIPQRARELYLRNRVRVLVDVHAQAAPLLPQRMPPAIGEPAAGVDLDMSMSTLRSMSPLHLQYLKNMGVTGTLVVSLVREGRLWGLIAAHHYSARALSPTLRSVCDLLAEVAATRIAAIENYAHAQVAILVRRLEQRLVEATSTEGDWRLALFRNPRTLLMPLDATGAALFHDGEWLTSGEVPSTPELRALLQWVDGQYDEAPFASSAVARANPAFDSLTPTASGVLAVKLSSQRPDYLMWFRKEQLRSVTWAGDPAKPVVDNNPLELSPRRSFAAWSEIVRGTALPWSGAELLLARAVGVSLVDIIVQVNAVRLLVAEHQLAGVRDTVQSSQEPVAITDGKGRLIFANAACNQLLGQSPTLLKKAADLSQTFAQPALFRRGLESAAQLKQAWRGELALAQQDLTVGVRAEFVPGRDGQVLGYIVVLVDLRDSRRVQAARQQLEQSLTAAASGPDERRDAVIGAILAGAGLAAMDIADTATGPGVAPLLEEVEASAKRAASLYARIRGWVQL